MGGTAITPDVNPFDKPFQSDIQAAQQAKAATPPQDSGLTNPFDAPFASDIAEKQAKSAATSGSWETPSDISSGPEGSNTDQQLMSEESQNDATKKGLIIGGAGATAVGGLAAGPLIAAGAGATPVIAEVGSHLAMLDRIVKLAKQYGWAADFGYREARDLYKEFAGDKK
jgi:hypothetical protein